MKEQEKREDVAAFITVWLPRHIGAQQVTLAVKVNDTHTSDAIFFGDFFFSRVGVFWASSKFWDFVDA